MTSEWRDAESMLITCLGGKVTLSEVETWRTGLYDASDAIPEGRQFALLIDFSGYDPRTISQDVHALMRGVIPTFLEAYDHRVSYLKIYRSGGAAAGVLRRGTCTAVAHVHADCWQVSELERSLGTTNERFFCSTTEAEAWLCTYLKQLA
ncbi:MAG: hypothetical protein JST22_00495 [Bacteroidetes bacterium]|nr:hypothetical protein [Bacteroidota bacterium]